LGDTIETIQEKGVAALMVVSYAHDADGALRKADRGREHQGDGADVGRAEILSRLDAENDENEE
jgi:hypothetical protein